MIYDIIKNGEIIDFMTTKKSAIKRAKELNADYIMLVIDFEPNHIVWENK